MKKNRKPLNFSLDLGHFPYRVGFSIGSDPEKIGTIAKRLKLWDGVGFIDAPISDGCCYEFNDGLTNSGSLVFLEKFPDRTSTVGILVHEVNHAVQNASRSLGFGPGHDADEFRCYSAQYLVTQVLKRCWK